MPSHIPESLLTDRFGSAIQTVLGFTRREGDAHPHCSGMSVLKSGNFEPADQAEKWRGSFAIFAQEEDGDIFQMHPTDDVAAAMSELRMSTYSDTARTGLSLAIPFPRKELTADRIIAAAIENFAPAIARGQLVLEVDGVVVDAASLEERANSAKSEFRSEGLRDDPKGILRILSAQKSEVDFELQMDASINGSTTLAEDELRAKIREAFEELENGETTNIDITVPVKRAQATNYGKLSIRLRPTPPGGKPIDMFYRGGMLLPDVRTSNKADIDVFIFTGDDDLNSYLNFCEGKAHLDLLGNTEVKAKLAEHGFENNLRLKNFVKNLPKTLRALVQPDSSRPDATVFAKWFSVPSAPKKGKKKKRKKVIIPPPPRPKEKYFFVTQKEDGFEVRANPNATGWPINLRVRVAYADGRAKPKWSPHDFRIKDLNVSVKGCTSQKIIELSGKNAVKGPEAGLNFIECTRVRTHSQ